MDAYHATAANVVFGDSKAAALSNYLTQLASESTSNGSAPGAGGLYLTETGTIASIGWDVSGGQKQWYVELRGDSGHVYEGTVSNVGPALVLAAPGDHVTMSILKVSAADSVRTSKYSPTPRCPCGQPDHNHPAPRLRPHQGQPGRITRSATRRTRRRTD